MTNLHKNMELSPRLRYFLDVEEALLFLKSKGIRNIIPFTKPFKSKHNITVSDNVLRNVVNYRLPSEPTEDHKTALLLLQKVVEDLKHV